MRLTKPNVNALKIPDGKPEIIVFDEELPGFGVRLRAGGKRTWIAQYRLGEKQRRVTIGTVEVFNADKARQEARNIIARVQLGGDPQVDKHAGKLRAPNTLGSLIAKYLSIYAERRLGARTLIEVRRTLTVQWKPLHEAAAHSLKRNAIAGRLAEIADKSGPFAANRARAYISAAFNWAIEQGLVDDNPVVGTGKIAKEVSRDRVLSDSELAMVWRQAGLGDYGRIIKLLILTGQRREEVAGMLWNEVNLETGVWSIGPARTKNGRAHDVPLSAEAQAVLRGVERREHRDYVFGAGNGPFSGWSKSKVALDKRLGAIGPKSKTMATWRIHDIRRTAATRMADIGVQPHIVEAILNHISGHKAGVAGTYNRSAYSAEKRAALAHWATHIQNLVEGDTA